MPTLQGCPAPRGAVLGAQLHILRRPVLHCGEPVGVLHLCLLWGDAVRRGEHASMARHAGADQGDSLVLVAPQQASFARLCRQRSLGACASTQGAAACGLGRQASTSMF